MRAEGDNVAATIDHGQGDPPKPEPAPAVTPPSPSADPEPEAVPDPPLAPEPHLEVPPFVMVETPRVPAPPPPPPKVAEETVIPVGREALQEALAKAGIGYPIDRAQLVKQLGGIRMSYRPGEFLSVAEVLGHSQFGVIHSEQQLQDFVQQFLIGQPTTFGGKHKPVFSDHYWRK